MQMVAPYHVKDGRVASASKSIQDNPGLGSSESSSRADIAGCTGFTEKDPVGISP